MRRIIIFPVPFALRSIWVAIKLFLDPVTASKVVAYGCTCGCGVGEKGRERWHGTQTGVIQMVRGTGGTTLSITTRGGLGWGVVRRGEMNGVVPRASMGCEGAGPGVAVWSWVVMIHSFLVLQLLEVAFVQAVLLAGGGRQNEARYPPELSKYVDVNTIPFGNLYGLPDPSEDPNGEYTCPALC